MLFARSNNGTGIREDAYANAHRIRVEVDNPSGSSAGVRIIPTGQASPPVRFGYWTGTTGRRPRLGATWAKGARRARRPAVPGGPIVAQYGPVGFDFSGCKHDPAGKQSDTSGCLSQQPVRCPQKRMAGNAVADATSVERLTSRHCALILTANFRRAAAATIHPSKSLLRCLSPATTAASSSALR
jgi:hypothetical protein